MDHWLAHHLAELIAEADRSKGAARTAAEEQAVDVILKLWRNRCVLPEAADPLGGYRKAIAVLERMAPQADPWRNLKRFSRLGGYDGLLHEMFLTLSRSVLTGLILTQVSRTRSILPDEAKGLEPEELQLQSDLEKWILFLSHSQGKSDILPTSEGRHAEGDEVENIVGDPKCASESERNAKQHMAEIELNLRSEMIKNLERMHSDTAAIIERLRRTEGNTQHIDDYN